LVLKETDIYILLIKMQLADTASYICVGLIATPSRQLAKRKLWVGIFMWQ